MAADNVCTATSALQLLNSPQSKIQSEWKSFARHFRKFVTFVKFFKKKYTQKCTLINRCIHAWLLFSLCSFAMLIIIDYTWTAILGQCHGFTSQRPFKGDMQRFFWKN